MKGNLKLDYEKFFNQNEDHYKEFKLQFLDKLLDAQRKKEEEAKEKQ